MSDDKGGTPSMLALGDQVQEACAKVPGVIGFVVVNLSGEVESRSPMEREKFKAVLRQVAEAL